MEITKIIKTELFNAERGNYRFSGSCVREDGKITSVHANVAMVVDDDTTEDLGYISIRKVAGKDVKTISEELLAGVQTLIRELKDED